MTRRSTEVSRAQVGEEAEMGPAAADTSQKTGPGPVRATPEASGGSTQTCTHKKGTANLPTVPHETVAVLFCWFRRLAVVGLGGREGCLGRGSSR